MIPRQNCHFPQNEDSFTIVSWKRFPEKLTFSSILFSFLWKIKAVYFRFYSEITCFFLFLLIFTKNRKCLWWQIHDSRLLFNNSLFSIYIWLFHIGSFLLFVIFLSKIDKKQENYLKSTWYYKLFIQILFQRLSQSGAYPADFFA